MTLKKFPSVILVIFFLGVASPGLAKKPKHPKAEDQKLTSPTATQVNGVAGVRGLGLQKPAKKKTWTNKKSNT